jgi:hemerythrin superfamily protein
MDYSEYIKNHTLRCEAGYRGGGIEIDCTELFPYIEDAEMTAYQNYLGGGMLGAIQSDNNFEGVLKKKDRRKFGKLREALKRYFHNLTNHEGDEWEEETYEQNQLKPRSAY